MRKVEFVATTDISAVVLSSLCIIHCMALPVMVTLMPLAAVWAEAEWVHKAFVLVALLISGYGIFVDLRAGRGYSFPIAAVIGLGLLMAAAYIEPLHDQEKLLTVLGGFILSCAHIWRWNRRSRLRISSLVHNEH